MHRSYWQAIASDWDNEIFNTLARDRHHVISKTLLELVSPRLTVADFGCGVGRCLPLLARNFERVVALDWATACLEQARLRSRSFANVEVLRTSRANLAALSNSCDVTLAIQVVIHPDRKARGRALSQAVSLTRRGGWLVIVVPSLESVLHAETVRRVFRPRIKSEFDFEVGRVFRDPGVLSIGGQPTKHYVADEICLLLRVLGCVSQEPRRVEYSWRIYNARMPRRFDKAPPWDWLVLARRE
jgi:SAM-dependent methyltransferase